MFGLITVPQASDVQSPTVRALRHTSILLVPSLWWGKISERERKEEIERKGKERRKGKLKKNPEN